MSRPPMEESERRNVIFTARVKPASAERFRAAAASLDLSPSEALRQAVIRWIKWVEEK